MSSRGWCCEPRAKGCCLGPRDGESVAECAAKLGNLSHSHFADHGKLLLSASRFNVVAIIIPPENVPASARGLSVDAVVVSTFVLSKA